MQIDEGLTLEMSDFQSLYGGQFTLSTPLINQLTSRRRKESKFYVEHTYETFYGNELPLPTHFLIFMAEVATDIINQSPNIPLICKRIIDDIFSVRNTNKEAINNFTELANSFHPAIKFTAEISDTEITFLDTCVCKGDRFFKPTESFQYTHFDSCHPTDVRKGFIKGEALRRLRTNSSKAKFDEHIALLRPYQGKFRQATWAKK